MASRRDGADFSDGWPGAGCRRRCGGRPPAGIDVFRMMSGVPDDRGSMWLDRANPGTVRGIRSRSCPSGEVTMCPPGIMPCHHEFPGRYRGEGNGDGDETGIGAIRRDRHHDIDRAPLREPARGPAWTWAGHGHVHEAMNRSGWIPTCRGTIPRWTPDIAVRADEHDAKPVRETTPRIGVRHPEDPVTSSPGKGTYGYTRRDIREHPSMPP